MSHIWHAETIKRDVFKPRWNKKCIFFNNGIFINSSLTAQRVHEMHFLTTRLFLKCKWKGTNQMWLENIQNVYLLLHLIHQIKGILISLLLRGTIQNMPITEQWLFKNNSTKSCSRMNVLYHSIHWEWKWKKNYFSRRIKESNSTTVFIS